jgi:hypothetical protein
MVWRVSRCIWVVSRLRLGALISGDPRGWGSTESHEDSPLGFVRLHSIIMAIVVVAGVDFCRREGVREARTSRTALLLIPKSISASLTCLDVLSNPRSGL